MKAAGQPWCIFPRNKANGILYFQLKNTQTGKYMSAKSTGTKDRNEAIRFVSRWWSEYDRTGKVQKHPKKPMIAAPDYQQHAINESIKAYTKTALEIILQGIQDASCSKNTPQLSSLEEAYEDAPEEVQSLLDQRATITFYEYIQLYWNYTESPYIKGFTRRADTPPNPERFSISSKMIKKYAQYFPNCRLTEITGAKIDTLLGTIKKAGKLKDTTMRLFRYLFIQPLRYAYRYNLLARDVSQHISRELKCTRKKAKKEAEKAIFSKEEIHRLFKSDENPFTYGIYQLINELLFMTGCRIGELQALQIQDLIKTKDGYMLNINKNYCRAGNRLKCTKTERIDKIPLSADLAAKLLAHIEKHPLKGTPEAFIFFSTKKIHTPINYETIRKNFHTTMDKLQFTRPHLTLHSYRHTFATFLRIAGFSEEDLRLLTRHDSIGEVRLYADHYTPEMEQLKQQAVRTLDTLLT